jgi:GT2 family glycosyltransferase
MTAGDETLQSASAAPQVAIIILTWNGKDDVLRCLSTLPRIRYSNWRATVVDNASTDGTVEAIRRAYPEQRVLVMEKNLGFCGGNNRGIADALAHGADYVLLLNNDTELHPDLLDELVNVARANSTVGAVGAKNILMDDHRVIWGAYGMLRYDRDLVHVVGAGQRDGPQYSCVKNVDSVIGNGMLMSRAALAFVTGLDERFFGYHEDVDWCERARKAGFGIVYNGRAIIYHKGHGAARPGAKVPFPVVYFHGRNSLLFARKHGSRWQLCKFVALFLLGVAGSMILSVRRGERMKPHLWLLRGFADGMLGRLPLRGLRLQ